MNSTIWFWKKMQFSSKTKQKISTFKLPGVIFLRTFVLDNFWTDVSNVFPGICWSHSPSFGVTTLSAPIIMGTTYAFISHILSCSSFSRWYFLELLMFLLYDIVVTYDCLLLCFLTTMISCWLATTILSALIWKSHGILVWLLSIPLGCVFTGTSSPHLAQLFLYTRPATCLRYSKYTIPSCTLRSAVMCCMV